MPPIPMKADRAADASSAPRPRGSVHEMTDDAKSLGGRSLTSRPTSPEATPRTSSRPASVQDALDIPDIKFPKATLGASDDDSKTPQIRPSATSYFDDEPTTTSTKPSTSSADLILPILIYSVVQANPTHLASHLAFIQRFRAESLLLGEASYCLVNLQAVLEFLLNVDMNVLGLSTSRILESVATAPPMRNS